MVHGREMIMKRFMTLFKIELMIGLRCPDVIVFGLLFPVAIFFLIAITGGNQSVNQGGITFMQSAFAALLTVGICANALMALPLTLADYRDKKVLKHFFVTPVSPFVLLGIHLLKCILVSFISSLFVVLSAIIFFNYSMQGSIILFIGAYILVLLSMFSLGMIIASVAKTLKAANVVTSCIYFPMLFLSGATIPFELFPRIVQDICSVLPLTQGITLLKSISLGIYNNGLWVSVAILLVYTLIGCVVSITRFKWD